MKWMLPTGLAIVLVGLLVACGGAEPERPTAISLSPMQMELNSAIEAWQAHDVASYSMKIQYNHPGWNPQILEVVVQDNEATIQSHDCMPERTCARRSVEAGDFTIDAILDVAELLAAQGTIRHIVYHEEYDFPRIVDSSDGTWTISDFQPLVE